MGKVVSRRGVASALVAVVLLAATGAGAAWSFADRGGHGRGGHDGGRDDKLLFFAADGLRQDTVERYARQGAVPGFRELLRKGAKA
jgi:hypothetical protein